MELNTLMDNFHPLTMKENFLNIFWCAQANDGYNPYIASLSNAVLIETVESKLPILVEVSDYQISTIQVNF